MKKTGTRTYRGVAIVPTLGGWSYNTIGIDGAGQRYNYGMTTNSLATAKYNIAHYITAGTHTAIDGALVKKES
ncbi:hypothetical protein UFOVP433_8 [uncultured Caudovirales phage]|uniref:Uncharacterized protein n=1 Tax=uncultured Caudovirales phage TaxID=2100421 RepID=A0A6J5MB97_9CAUD|nr:hypothetical protein UFOVP433_8 [uncultured Caudovirales phage]CAB4158444.1 hypothetical protein UFOVP702_11 [uncultured Caudovirales phage]